MNKQLLTEIKINIGNAYQWFRITPKEYASYFDENTIQNLLYAFIFNVDENHTYIVVYNKNKELHFWNKSEEDKRPDVEAVLYDDLSLFNNNEIYKLIATMFSIMVFLTKKEFNIFIIRTMTDKRYQLYKNLIKGNLNEYFSGFEILELPDGGIGLFKQRPFKESQNFLNVKFDKFIESILKA